MSSQSLKPRAKTVLRFPHEASAAPELAASLLPVLIILHQETSTPGRVGNALRALGYRLDIRRPRFGDPLPETLDHHAGAVIFGGPMSANDPDEYVRREIDWIEVALDQNRSSRHDRIVMSRPDRARDDLPRIFPFDLRSVHQSHRHAGR